MAVEAETLSQPTAFKSLWWVCLAALLAVLILETLLALRFGHYLRGHTAPELSQ